MVISEPSFLFIAKIIMNGEKISEFFSFHILFHPQLIILQRLEEPNIFIILRTLET